MHSGQTAGRALECRHPPTRTRLHSKQLPPKVSKTHSGILSINSVCLLRIHTQPLPPTASVHRSLARLTGALFYILSHKIKSTSPHPESLPLNDILLELHWKQNKQTNTQKSNMIFFCKCFFSPCFCLRGQFLCQWWQHQCEVGPFAVYSCKTAELCLLTNNDFLAAWEIIFYWAFNQSLNRKLSVVFF